MAHKVGVESCVGMQGLPPHHAHKVLLTRVCMHMWPGAGDQFAAGFLFGLMRGYGLRKCAQLGCLAGGAVVQVVGAEMTQAAWRWLFARCARGMCGTNNNNHNVNNNDHNTNTTTLGVASPQPCGP